MFNGIIEDCAFTYIRLVNERALLPYYTKRILFPRLAHYDELSYKERTNVRFIFDTARAVLLVKTTTVRATEQHQSNPHQSQLAAYHAVTYV